VVVTVCPVFVVIVIGKLLYQNKNVLLAILQREEEKWEMVFDYMRASARRREDARFEYFSLMNPAFKSWVSLDEAK
jgi:hypothetical protein